jgi:hypothetical protein
MKKTKNLFSPEVGAKNPVSPELPRPSQGSFMHISDPSNGDLRDRQLVNIEISYK